LSGTAFIIEQGHPVALNDFIDPTGGWDLQTALDVNNLGEIVGQGMFDPDGGGPAPASLRAFLLTPIPEPQLVLLASGTLASICHSRRRQITSPASAD
jgi:hypothetical protein